MKNSTYKTLLLSARKMFSAIVVSMILSIAAAAQVVKPPKNLKIVAPDLQVKSVKMQWFEIKGRGYYLEITPTIQKNKQDKITTEAGKPMIIFVGTMLQGAIPGPVCRLEVSEWTSEETEKSFGTCTLKYEEYQVPMTGLVIVDDGNRVKELKENNNVYNLGDKIPPKPSN